MFELRQKDILKELNTTLQIIQRPKTVQPPALDLEEGSQQTKLLKEIDFFCQKLTTQKKKLKSPQNQQISTNLFTCSSQLLLQQQDPQELEPDLPAKLPIKEHNKQETACIPNLTNKNMEKTKTQPKLIIKKLKFIQEDNDSWVPIRIEKRIQEFCLNVCIFWPDEELMQLKFKDINLLVFLNKMKEIDFLKSSIKTDSSQDIWQFNLLLTQFYKQLKIFAMIICLNDILSIREHYIRLHEIDKQLRSDGIFERKKNMLTIEQKRIHKKLILHFLRLQTKYKKIIGNNINEVDQVRKLILLKSGMKGLFLNCKVKAEKQEYYFLVADHMKLFRLKQYFHLFRLTAYAIKLERQSKGLLKLFLKQSFTKWRNVKQRDEQISEFLSEEKQSISEEPTIQKQQKQQESQEYRLIDNQYKLKQLQIDDFNLREEYKHSCNPMKKIFIKWKLAYSHKQRNKIISKILSQQKLRRIFHHLQPQADQIGEEINSILLQRKALKSLKKNLQVVRSYRSIKQQREQINSMAKMVYEGNLLKKAYGAWNDYRKDKKMKDLLESLSIEEKEKEKEIIKVKQQIIVRKRKDRLFQKWRDIYRNSKTSVKNIQYLESVTREKAIQQLIRIAFESSLQTQFKWLEYYSDD